MSKKVAVIYIPVLHKGYIDFIESFPRLGVTELYLVGDDILAVHKELDYINRKDRIRALDEIMDEFDKRLNVIKDPTKD